MHSMCLMYIMCMHVQVCDCDNLISCAKVLCSWPIIIEDCNLPSKPLSLQASPSASGACVYMRALAYACMFVHVHIFET